jgi:SAM-dependent methyltransferase
MTPNKQILNATELWHLNAEALHDQSYLDQYTAALTFLIRDTKLHILDTACGSGFPTTSLYQLGFTNIEASDADADSVAKLSRYFQNLNLPIPVSEGMWQELSNKIDRKFDVILNTDNSLVYMDGWSENGSVASGFENISQRISLVLKNFYDLLNPNGFVIIGLGKHYDPIASDDYWKNSSHRIFHATENEQAVQIEWKIKTDWQETRHLNWTITAEGNEVTGITEKKAYLITKNELADMMHKIGFSTVHILDPDGTRDNLIVGMKSNRFKL